MAYFKGNYSDFQDIQVQSLKKIIEENPKNRKIAQKEIERINKDRKIKSN